ncbi:MAG: hypothetical protein GY866_41545 [Proteobacteria bacterium]|nr:hypothetical protein [Pseudomonadota bacterium]
MLKNAGFFRLIPLPFRFSYKFAILLLVGSLSCSAANATDIASLKRLIIGLAPQGCVLLQDENGNSLFSHHPDKVLIPASIIKIFTALATFELLGRDFHFKTEFYLNRDNSLLIKGWGDPFLISEEIALIAEELKSRGLTSINEIVLDHSSFSDGYEISGTKGSLNPYDALNGALVVNFNTVNIEKTPDGKVFSAEDATPLTPLAIEKGRLLVPGSRLRINLTDRKEESLQYSGELFYEFFRKSGFVVENRRISLGFVDKSSKLVYRHHNTRTLDFIIEGLFKYSNNFIANQVFLVIGGERKGYPATLEKSQAVFNDFAERTLDIESGEFIVDEASGISAKNRITGKIMMRILEKFRDYSHLLSLKNGIRVKSGTLTGVYNYAGYFETAAGMRPFVIMMKQKRNNRDKILRLLRQFSLLHETKSRDHNPKRRISLQRSRLENLRPASANTHRSVVTIFSL